MSDALLGAPRRGGGLPRLPSAAALLAWAALERAGPGGPARFLVAGGLASGLNWLVRFPLSAVLPFVPSVALAYALGMSVGFVLYRSWVFPGSTLPLGQQLMRFVFVNLGGLAAVVLGAKAVLAALSCTGFAAVGPAEAVAHALAIVLGALVNFAGHRALTFARRPGRSGALRRQ